MATIHKHFTVAATLDRVWDALTDLGAVHTRLARVFVVDTKLEGASRLVTFANGITVRERIVSVDAERRRLAYAVTEWELTHHNASFQLFEGEGGTTRIEWVADLLPHDLAGVVDGMMEQGVAAIARTFEQER